jgi:hypothetical protein
MRDFVRDMIAVRKAHEYAFAPGGYGAGAPFAWKNPGNGDMAGADWDGRAMMQHYYDVSFGPELLVIYNFVRTDVAFTLPAGRTWRRVLDTQLYFDDTAYLEANSLPLQETANIDLAGELDVGAGPYVAKGTSIVILRADLP